MMRRAMVPTSVLAFRRAACSSQSLVNRISARAARRTAMPPRNPTPSATIGPVPGDVLANILAQLELTERHRTAALVCRGWRDAVGETDDRPELLQTLNISIGSGPHFLPRLRSLNTWFIARAARHVRQLRLRLESQREPQDYDDAEGDDQEEETKGIITAMLVGCGTLGQLIKLDLEVDLDFCASSWLALLGSSLRHLGIAATKGRLSGTCLQGLTGLQELDLGSMHILTLEAARLPASLTKLHLWGLEQDELPEQVACLSRLVDLELGGSMGIEPEGYDLLTGLGSLRKLTLDECCVPACLGQLSALEVLILADLTGEEDGETLRDALPLLTALTSLALDGMSGVQSPPTEMAGLSQLRRFAWLGRTLDDAALPAGPWLGGLQRLVAPAALLANSLQQLSAAGQLDQVGVIHVEGRQEAAAAVVRWAVGRLSLRHVVLQESAQSLEAAVAARQAQRTPQLCIELKQTPWVVSVAILDSP